MYLQDVKLPPLVSLLVLHPRCVYSLRIEFKRPARSLTLAVRANCATGRASELRHGADDAGHAGELFGGAAAAGRADELRRLPCGELYRWAATACRAGKLRNGTAE